ncbi:MAG: carbohydrate ABC transporter permease [Candidatus Ornithospirochaeta sp.]
MSTTTLKRISGRVFYNALAVCLSLVAVVPFLWMLTTSLKSSGALMAIPIEWIPKHPALDNYLKLLKVSGLIRSVFNSIMVTVMAVSLALVSSAMAAFAFSKIKFHGSGILFMAFIASMMIPSQVVFIPLYLVMNELKLTNTLLSVVLPYSFKAFAVFMLRQQMMGISDTYLDAAAIDGAGLWTSFWRVFMPLCSTAVVTLGIIVCMDSWNDYLLPLVLLTDKRNYTLPIILNSMSGQYKNQYNLLMAGSLISVLPLLVLYGVCNRYFKSGLQVGGIKG